MLKQETVSMHLKKFKFTMLFILLAALLEDGLAHGQISTGSDKIEPKVLADMSRGRSVTFFVVLGDQADVSHATAIRDWKSRGEAVVNSLRQHAAKTQAPILDVLTKLNVEITPFWIVNTI